ncbi:hypothetical protein AVEN_163296-1 [Araneus ventricosus]|uniref:Uncharacterized protein n=1 Tax=Araneus ventricosus TaxID=182803 RepID=A0A4Y2LHV8_ARAVE|nr:hypothetical protein AVEN_163296-1 [Araneus ventricosus]
MTLYTRFPIDIIKDVKLYLEYIAENHHVFQNQTLPGALREYCHTEGDEQQDLHNKIADAIRSLQKVVCADSDLADMCSRSAESIVRHHFLIE